MVGVIREGEPMSRSIDADALKSIKYHPLPYTHIVPEDVDAEAYERGWNDAVDAVVEYAPTIEPERKTGQWKVQAIKGRGRDLVYCSECGFGKHINETRRYNFCPNCGADMRGDRNEEDKNQAKYNW